MNKLSKGSIYRDYDVIKLKVKDLYQNDINKYHPVTKLQTFGSKESRLAMALNIQEVGQTDPIAVYQKRGKVNVIDGRNRLWALNHNSEEFVLAIKLPSNSTLEELTAYSFSTRIKTHSTPAQLAIQAFHLHLRTGITQAAAALKVGAKKSLLEDASACYKINPQSIDKMFEKGSWTKINGRDTISLRAMLDDLKGRMESTPIPEGEPTGEPSYEELKKMLISTMAKMDMIETEMKLMSNALKMMSHVNSKVDKDAMDNAHKDARSEMTGKKDKPITDDDVFGKEA